MKEFLTGNNTPARSLRNGHHESSLLRPAGMMLTTRQSAWDNRPPEQSIMNVQKSDQEGLVSYK